MYGTLRPVLRAEAFLGSIFSTSNARNLITTGNNKCQLLFDQPQSLTSTVAWVSSHNTHTALHEFWLHIPFEILVTITAHRMVKTSVIYRLETNNILRAQIIIVAAPGRGVIICTVPSTSVNT